MPRRSMPEQGCRGRKRRPRIETNTEGERDIMRKLVCSLVVAFMVAGGSAIAASSGPVDTTQVRKDIAVSATHKKYSIATVIKVDGIAWFDRMREGVKEFGKDTGQDTWMVGPSQADAAAQVQIV